VSRDMQLVLELTAGAVVFTGLLGALVLQAIRRRSLLLSIVVAALVPVAAVSVAVALNVNQMFISGRVAGGISAPGSHGSVRDSLPSYGSCCPDHLIAGFAQAQCAKYRGWDAAACLIDWIAFFQVLSFLYLFMIHRNR
jgi:hypothetical protein